MTGAKFKIPKIRNEEGSQSTVRGRKRGLSDTGSEQDLGHVSDKKIM